jgi:large subunit ribosomal protein L15
MFSGLGLDMQLTDLKDNAGAVKARKRVGRGIGSGSGKTAGRGVKGQKSRSGVAIKGFEGGQMPIHMRLPKRGFNNPTRLKFTEINLGRLQAAVDEGKLDAKAPVTAETMVAAGLIRRSRDGVRLLGNGEIKAGLQIEVAGATASAVKAVESAGGAVKILRVVKETDPTERREKKSKKKKAGGSQE